VSVRCLRITGAGSVSQGGGPKAFDPAPLVPACAQIQEWNHMRDSQSSYGIVTAASTG
jgi:hypothetical protein